uniref:Uncharacterized protein n=1 Tax=Cannabis sativa TaxID=3483 RepID=A0A803PW72_CANSA
MAIYSRRLQGTKNKWRIEMAKRHAPVRLLSRKMGHTIAGSSDPTSFPKVKLSNSKMKLADNSLDVMMQLLYILRIEEQGSNSIGGVALEDNIVVAEFYRLSSPLFQQSSVDVGHGGWRGGRFLVMDQNISGAPNTLEDDRCPSKEKVVTDIRRSMILGGKPIQPVFPIMNIEVTGSNLPVAPEPDCTSIGAVPKEMKREFNH